MDARRKQTFPALLAGCGLMLAAAINADADVRIHAYAYADDHIHFSGDDIVITASGTPEARITPAGGFSIGGKAVVVDESQRRLLVQYSADAHDIERRGARIGVEGANMAMDILGDVFGGLLDGDSDKQIEANARSHTAGLKDAVRGLCDDMKSLQATQTRLAGTLAAFQPYAVITDEDVDHCYDDINHDED